MEIGLANLQFAKVSLRGFVSSVDQSALVKWFSRQNEVQPDVTNVSDSTQLYRRKFICV